MTKPTEQAHFWKALGRLEKNLDRATQWQAPSISLVLYDTAMNGSKAVSRLEDRLTRKGQHVVHITPDENGHIAIEEEFTLNKTWNETIFFVMHISFNADEAIYKTISDCSDFILNNRIRIVYWITEDDFATYISQMPENGIFEQHFYSLTEAPNWKSIWTQIGTHTWKNNKNRKGTLVFSANTPFEELFSLDIRDDLKGLVRRANWLNKYALFYTKQKEYNKAFLFAEKTLALAKYLQDETFLAKTSLVFLLTEIKLGHKNPSAQLRKQDVQKLDRHSETQVLLGGIYSLLYMHEDAKSAYQNAIDLDRSNPAAHKGLADTFLQEQQYNQAIALYQTALEIQQNFPAAWIGLGKAFKAVGNQAKALESYQSAVEINCFQPDLWLEISEISATKTAMLSIQRAIELKPEKALYWNMLGNIQYRNKKYNDALRSYYKASSIEKDFGWAYANMALIYQQVHQPEKATLLLVKSSQIFQNDFEKSFAQYRLGQVYQELGKYTEAAQAFRHAKMLFDNEQLFKNHVSTPGPMKLQAILSSTAEEEKVDFKKTKIRSTEPREKVSLKNVLSQQQKISYSETLKKALATNSKAHNIYYWLDLGDFYARNKLFDLAEDTYRIAIELEPKNGWTYYSLAKAYMFTGLYEEAIPLYEKSIELFKDPKDKASCWNQLANAYRRLNEYSLAVAAQERARLLAPPQKAMLARARASLLGNCYAH